MIPNELQCVLSELASILAILGMDCSKDAAGMLYKMTSR